jgi:hypothetical protein
VGPLTSAAAQSLVPAQVAVLSRKDPCALLVGASNSANFTRIAHSNQVGQEIPISRYIDYVR